ncbi:hypothetical protein AAFN86_22930 [Roseomonas sp. CAU 1739]|uniref:hypothetical protein n=1 Tax=Roseomonas sp. CAU 1739 TaxID=3140364 RepID=UPI00325BC70F
MTTPPRYDDLPRPTDDPTGLPLSWGVWGPDDEVGTLNRITEATVVAAREEIRTGRRFNFNLPLDEPFGLALDGAHRRRAAPHPVMVAEEHPGRVTRDDRLDGFWLQGSTQWDGLSHFADPTHGFYNHAPLSSIVHGAASRNGIDKALAHGIAGRCVLADLVRHTAPGDRTARPVSGGILRPGVAGRGQSGNRPLHGLHDRGAAEPARGDRQSRKCAGHPISAGPTTQVLHNGAVSPFNGRA